MVASVTRSSIKFFQWWRRKQGLMPSHQCSKLPWRHRAHTRLWVWKTWETSTLALPSTWLKEMLLSRFLQRLSRNFFRLWIKILMIGSLCRNFLTMFISLAFRSQSKQLLRFSTKQLLKDKSSTRPSETWVWPWKKSNSLWEADTALWEKWMIGMSPTDLSETTGFSCCWLKTRGCLPYKSPRLFQVRLELNMKSRKKSFTCRHHFKEVRSLLRKLRELIIDTNLSERRKSQCLLDLLTSLRQE